jgi:prepilin-type N-terminal cleavage/methylation domain-containing protein
MKMKFENFIKSIYNWRNQKGFSLVEIMIVAGIMGGLALSLTEVLRQANQGKKGIELRYEYVDVLNKMRMYLADAEVCRSTLGQPAGPNGSFTLTAAGDTIPIDAIVRTSRNGAPIAPVNYYVRAARAVALGDANLAVIDRKLRIADMNLVRNARDAALALPAAGTRETRLYDIRVNFETVNDTLTLPGGGVTFITIAGDTDENGLIHDCYTAWDQLAENVCNEMGGEWDPIGNPHRCNIRSVTADYACQELGGTIVAGNRREDNDITTVDTPQKTVPLPGTIAANTPNLTTNTAGAGAQKVCDLKEVTNRDACTFLNGAYDAGSNSCSLTNVNDLRQMACAMAGGAPTVGPGFTAFSGGGEVNAASYCQQTTRGACLMLGGTYGGGTNNTGNSDDTCTISCDTTSGTIFNSVTTESVMCGERMCLDLGGIWNSPVINQCNLAGDSRLREYACTTMGGTWTAGVPGFAGTECNFDNLFETMCTGIGGTWNTALTPDQCVINTSGLAGGNANERYDHAIKRQACQRIALSIQGSNSGAYISPAPINGLDTVAVVSDYNAGTGACTITYSSRFVTEEQAESTYKWKYATESVGLFNGAGGATNVDGTRNIGIGYNADASSNYSIAVGSSAVSSGSYSTAIGASSNSNANSIAIGRSANANSTSSVSAGYQSVASGNETVAVGYSADATALRSVAIGSNATATGDRSVAVGPSSNASGPQALAIGFRSRATTDFSTAVGGGDTECTGCTKKGVYNPCCITFSYGSEATAYKSTAIGSYTWAIQEGATAVGATATADGYYTTALGATATARGSQTVAIGFNAGTGTGISYSMALGVRAQVPGDWAVAFGADTYATGYQAMAIGDWSHGTADRALAFGSRARSAHTDTTVIGANCDSEAGYRLKFCLGGEATKIRTNGPSWTMSSSRELKTNFDKLNSDAEEYLEKLIQLPIYAYNLKVDPKGPKILGPVAEEFFDTFNLGDDPKGISETNINSVTILSVMALEKRNRKLQHEVDQQREMIAKLYEEIEKLNERMDEIKK